MMFNSVMVTIVLVAAAFGDAGSADEIRSGRQVETKLILTSSGKAVTAMLKITALTIETPGAATKDGELILVHDPVSQVYWWTFEMANGVPDLLDAQKRFLTEYQFAIDQNRIVGFFADGRSLWIRSSNEKAESESNAIRNAVDALRGSLPAIRSGAMSWFREVNLSQVLGVAFFSPRHFGDPSRGLQLVSVAWSRGGWDVEVKNDRGQKRVIKLNEDLEVKSVEER